MKKALVCGSFDPVTVGHMDLIIRAARLFDELTVGVFVNSSKKYMLDSEVRARLIREACEEAALKNVKVVVSDGLVANYVRDNGIDVIVKGVRNGIDYDYEKNLADANKIIYEGAETLLMLASDGHSGLSSSLVREMLRHGVDVSELVPASVMRHLNSTKD